MSQITTNTTKPLPGLPYYMEDEFGFCQREVAEDWANALMNDYGHAHAFVKKQGHDFVVLTTGRRNVSVIRYSTHF